MGGDGNVEGFEQEVAGVGEGGEGGDLEGGGGGDAGADRERGIAGDVGAGDAAGKLTVLGEDVVGAGDVSGPVPRAGELLAHGIHGEERGGAPEIVEGEFNLGGGGGAGGLVSGLVELCEIVGLEDDLAVVAWLEGDGGGECEGHFADERAGVVGDAAHDVEAAGGAGEGDVAAGGVEIAAGVGADSGEEFGNGGERGGHEGAPETMRGWGECNGSGEGWE